MHVTRMVTAIEASIKITIDVGIFWGRELDCDLSVSEARQTSTTLRRYPSVATWMQAWNLLNPRTEFGVLLKLVG